MRDDERPCGNERGREGEKACGMKRQGDRKTKVNIAVISAAGCQCALAVSRCSTALKIVDSGHPCPLQA